MNFFIVFRCVDYVQEEKRGLKMYVRLVIATVSEESTVDDLLSYVEGTAMPSFDGQEGLLTFAAMKVL